jgi:hypothetical protein
MRGGQGKPLIELFERRAGARTTTARIFARFVSQIIFDKLAEAEGGAMMAGTGIVGVRGNSKGRVSRIVGIVAVVYTPIESVTKEFLGPSLGVA